MYPSTTNEPPKLPAYSKVDNTTEPKTKTKRPNDPFFCCPGSIGRKDSPNNLVQQIAWWQSWNHWNHVRLFKGRRLFQETGSHCQSFGLSFGTCDWFVNHQRARHNHASPRWTTTLLRLTECLPTAKCTYTHTYCTWAHIQTCTRRGPNTFLPVWITCWTISHGH